MFDKILKVIRITGEFLSFYAIVYLEDGVYPSAIMRADFPVESGLIGFRQSAELTQVESAVSHLVKRLSSLYAYPIYSISDRESLQSGQYAEILEATRLKFAERRESDCSSARPRLSRYLQ